MALFDDSHARALPKLSAIRDVPMRFEDSVSAAVHEAWDVLARHGAARTMMMGMVEGLANPRIGPAYLDKMFDPFIRALTNRLSGHIECGEMRPTDARMAALTLAAPLLMAAVHQNELGGRSTWPLEDRAFLDHLAAGFIRAYRNG